MLKQTHEYYGVEGNIYILFEAVSCLGQLLLLRVGRHTFSAIMGEELEMPCECLD